MKKSLLVCVMVLCMVLPAFSFDVVSYIEKKGHQFAQEASSSGLASGHIDSLLIGLGLNINSGMIEQQGKVRAEFIYSLVGFDSLASGKMVGLSNDMVSMLRNSKVESIGGVYYISFGSASELSKFVGMMSKQFDDVVGKIQGKGAASFDVNEVYKLRDKYIKEVKSKFASSESLLDELTRRIGRERSVAGGIVYDDHAVYLAMFSVLQGEPVSYDKKMEQAMSMGVKGKLGGYDTCEVDGVNVGNKSVSEYWVSWLNDYFNVVMQDYIKSNPDHIKSYFNGKRDAFISKYIYEDLSEIDIDTLSSLSQSCGESVDWYLDAYTPWGGKCMSSVRFAQFMVNMSKYQGSKYDLSDEFYDKLRGSISYYDLDTENAGSNRVYECYVLDPGKRDTVFSILVDECKRMKKDVNVVMREKGGSQRAF